MGFQIFNLEEHSSNKKKILPSQECDVLCHFPICIYLMVFVPHKLNTDNSRCYCETLITDIVERALQTTQHQASANMPSPENHYSKMGLPSLPQSPIPTPSHRENIQRTYSCFTAASTLDSALLSVIKQSSSVV